MTDVSDDVESCSQNYKTLLNTLKKEIPNSLSSKWMIDLFSDPYKIFKETSNNPCLTDLDVLVMMEKKYYPTNKLGENAITSKG